MGVKHLAARAINDWLIALGYETEYGRYESATYAHITVKVETARISLCFTATRVLSDEDQTIITLNSNPSVWAAQQTYLRNSNGSKSKPACELQVEFENPDLLDLVRSYIDYRVGLSH